jgi:hypothetical protein
VPPEDFAILLLGRIILAEAQQDPAQIVAGDRVARPSVNGFGKNPLRLLILMMAIEVDAFGKMKVILLLRLRTLGKRKDRRAEVQDDSQH